MLRFVKRKMEGGEEEVLEINNIITKQKITGNNTTILEQDWGDFKPVLPVASGGLNPLQLPILIEILGNDMIYQFGGGCHGHPNGTEAGAKAIRQATDAVLQGYKLKDFAKNHSELASVIETWG